MRERIAYAVILASFAIIWSGLFYTQVIRFGYYSRLAKNNSIRIIPIDGPRGNIFDRSGKVLASSRLSFDVAVIHNELKDTLAVARIMKNVLGMSGHQILQALEKAGARPFAPVSIAEDIDKDKAIMFEEESFGIDGVFVQTRSRRDYIYGAALSHIIGYVGEITEDELEGMEGYGYRPRDMVGRGGLEKYYDLHLKGVDGGTQVEVDNRGRQKRVLGIKEPQSGKDLHTTVDIDIQLACDKALAGKKGAAIAMNPRTGEVLALSSHPSYDPNVFVKGGLSRERLMLIQDKKRRPMTDRAVSGLYPPGSVFKVVTAAACLESGKINQYTRFICNGSYKLGRGSFACWKEEGHGSQNLKLGIMNSCNVFFYNIGRLAGVDQIEKYSKIFGLGALTGIDLPDEAKGSVPGKTWKLAKKNDAWYEGETINYSIGQGYLMVTPIQVLNMYSIIASGSGSARPHLAMDIAIDRSDIVNRPDPGIRQDTIRQIRQGLYEVVNNESGTGRRAQVKGVAIAGKTGTAQNPLGRTHAWFAGFAPYDDPKLSVVVLLEHGGKGGLRATEVAKAIFAEAKAKGYI